MNPADPVQPADPVTPGAAVPAALAAYVGIGANLGDARASVAAALLALAALPQSRLRGVSPLYRSAPVEASGPDFINAVAWLDTRLAAPALLAGLQAIERRFGRQRPYHHAPRSLDLDLLLLGDLLLQTPSLTLPHPRLHLRAFVLRPLLDLSPALAAPGLGPLAAYLAATAQQTIERLPTAWAASPAA